MTRRSWWEWTALISGPAVMSAAGIYGVKMMIEARAASLQANCLSGMLSLNKGMRFYAEDNDGMLPLGANWRDQSIQSYRDPDAKYNCQASKSVGSYAMNKAVAGVSLASIKHIDRLVSIFEVEGTTWNTLGGREDISYRHQDKANFAFLNGGVKAFSASNWALTLEEIP